MDDPSSRPDAEEVDLAAEARQFLASHPWCARVRRVALKFTIPDYLGVFLCTLVPRAPEVDTTLWVVVGDLPAAYLVHDAPDTWQDALAGYVGEMRRWVEAVRTGASLDDVIPVDAPATRQVADMLASRLDYIQEQLVDVDPETLELIDVESEPEEEEEEAAASGDDWEEFLAEATAYLGEQQDAVVREFDLESWERFRLDPKAGTLTFSTGGTPGVVAQVLVVGSIQGTPGAWRWAWADASAPESMREPILRVRQFGEEHGFDKLVDPTWPGERTDGWEMASAAALLLSARGAYRAPFEGGFIFLIFTDIHRVQ